MTDDIVTRLRDRVGAMSEFVSGHSVGKLMYEAADEIERLREQVAEYKNLYLLRSRLGDSVGGV